MLEYKKDIEDAFKEMMQLHMYIEKDINCEATKYFESNLTIIQLFL